MTTKAAVCCFVIIVFSNTLLAQPAPLVTGNQKSVSPASQHKAEVDLVEGKVISVDNGDTITVKASKRDLYIVKMQAIDAPDVGQPHYRESKDSLSKLIRGKNVTVVVHARGPSSVVIGTVYRDRRDVGLSLLEIGLAWHYKRPPYQQTATSEKTYSTAQNNASAAGLGIWAGASPVPPWVFRGEVVAPGPQAGEPSLASASSGPQANGRKYVLGPRGGCYYVSESGGKVYVRDKRLCGIDTPQTKP